MGQKITIVRTLEQLESLQEYLIDKDLVAFDTETTGLKIDSEVIGFSVCAEPDVSFYVITAYWDPTACVLKYTNIPKGRIAKFLERLKSANLVMHNGVFDCGMVFRNYGVSLIENLYCDTMILAHVIDENRRVGLKDLGAKFYGKQAVKEQEEMEESIKANGGSATKANYELYKADCELIAKYGAKDTILTYNLFFELIPQLIEEGMQDFFFTDESMPLLRDVTYQLNTNGLKIDLHQLKKLERDLEVKILELKGFIHKEIEPLISDKPDFNINSGAQLAWLLFDKMGQVFPKVSDAGKELCKYYEMKIPYNNKAKVDFIKFIKEAKGQLWNGKKVRDYWCYLATDKVVISKFAEKYKWVAALQELKKCTKLLTTYIKGIQEGTQYGVIYPSFLQHGTTGGRYSSRAPNFQNLPGDEKGKEVKKCILPRPGKAFVGADYRQIEPRILAAYSQDERLLNCFRTDQDFYSVIGTAVFDITDSSLHKEDPNFFGNLHPKERKVSKTVGLSSIYGTTGPKLATVLDCDVETAQYIIDKFFEEHPKVEKFMIDSHERVKADGYVQSMFGRKRRIPEAKKIKEVYGNASHAELPYTQRSLLNLSVNHQIQSTAASIINRAAVLFVRWCRERSLKVSIVLQVHDELVAECLINEAELVAEGMKYCMETAVKLPGVDLIVDPKIAYNLADIK